MTRTHQLLLVGDVDAETVDAIESIDGADVARAADADEGLYRLATTVVDCVVTSQRVLDGGTPFVEALDDRPDIPVVPVPATDATAGSEGEEFSAEPSGVAASVKNALGISDEGTDAGSRSGSGGTAHTDRPQRGH